MEKWFVGKPEFESDQLNTKLRVAPWEGHRWFAYDYIKHVEPHTVIELGTHYGCSFFSFCQAVKDYNLKTKLIAVDTWEGDEQAGHYGEEVYSTVVNTVENFFSEIAIELKRMTFDGALNEISDNSVDLLHIDGLHTYEAVKYDFESWVPKLSKDGVVFFHDVFSPLEYGSNTYWSEIKKKYSFLEFKHSWGLGILFPKGNRIYNLLLEQGFDDKIELYTYKALYELEKIKTKDLSVMVEERDKTIKSNEKMIGERDSTILTNEFMIKERDKTINNMEVMIRERDRVIQHNEELILERDRTINHIESMIDERDIALSATEKMVQERDRTVVNMESIIEERDHLCMEMKTENQKLSADIELLENKLDITMQKITYYENKKIILNLRKKKN